jgi:TPR repeat protein
MIDANYATAVKRGHLEGQYIADIARLPVDARDAEVFALTRKYAAKGLKEARYQLAHRYLEGRVVKQSREKHQSVLRELAAHAEVLAMLYLGDSFKRERIEEHTQAFAWITRGFNLCSPGDSLRAPAALSLGECHYDGTGTPRNLAEAVKYFLIAAEGGEQDAQNRLGICLRNGIGIAIDHAQALVWLRKAASQGDAFALANLRVMYWHCEGLARTAENMMEGFAMMNKAALAGHSLSQDAFLLLLRCCGESARAAELEGEFKPPALCTPQPTAMAPRRTALRAPLCACRQPSA